MLFLGGSLKITYCYFSLVNVKHAIQKIKTKLCTQLFLQSLGRMEKTCLPTESKHDTISEYNDDNDDDDNVYKAEDNYTP